MANGVDHLFIFRRRQIGLSSGTCLKTWKNQKVGFDDLDWYLVSSCIFWMFFWIVRGCHLSLGWCFKTLRKSQPFFWIQKNHCKHLGISKRTLLVMWFRLVPIARIPSSSLVATLPLIAIPSSLHIHRDGQDYEPQHHLLQRLSPKDLILNCNQKKLKPARIYEEKALENAMINPWPLNVPLVPLYRLNLSVVLTYTVPTLGSLGLQNDRWRTMTHDDVRSCFLKLVMAPQCWLARDCDFNVP